MQLNNGNLSASHESDSNGHDFDEDTRALCFEIMLEIDRVDYDRGLQWVFDIGWSQKFDTESVPAEVPLRAIAAMVRLSLEKDAVGLLDFLLDVLADAVRRHDDWRVLFGECDIVGQCLGIMQQKEEAESQEMGATYVRIVRLLANCCGDPRGDGSADANRAQVVAKMPMQRVLTMMRTRGQQTEAVSLVYNVGVYNETFRAAAIEAGLLPALWDVLQVLGRPSSNDLRALGLACEMLAWPPTEVDATSGVDAYHILLECSWRNLSCEQVESLIDTMSFILDRHGLPEDPQSFADLLDLMSSTCLSDIKTHSSATSPAKRFSGEDEELLEEKRKSWIIQLSELSGQPTGALEWHVDSPPIVKLLRWVPSHHFQLQICSLTILGNLAYQSESISTALILGDLGQKLPILLKTDRNGLVLKTALAAVQRFARSVHHRDALGQLDFLEAIAPSWTQGINLPLQTAALSATRHLLSGSLQNISRFLTVQGSPEKSLLDDLLETYRNSEVFDSRLEIARTLERMWRSIYGDPDVRNIFPEDCEVRTVDKITTSLVGVTIPQVYQTHTDVLEPFRTILASGNKDDAIAATYTLSTMLTSREGYETVYRELCEGEGRAVILATLRDAGNPKAQLNAQTLIRQLGSYFANNNERSTSLTHIMEEASQARNTSVGPP